MATAAAATFASGLSAGAAGTAATAATILSGTTQALGALASREAAEFRAGSLEDQAGLADIRAEQESTRGRQRANSIRDELVRNIASQQAAAGASGLATSSGAIQTGIGASIREGQREIRLVRRNADQRSQARRMRAFRLRQEAGFARESGRVQQRFGLLGAFSDVAGRGFVPGGGDGGGSSSLGTGTGSSPLAAGGNG